MHGIRVWKASLCDALEAQQTLTASSIPSSAWDDPARIEFEGSVKSCRCLRSEPELCAVDPHPMKHDGNLAGDSDDGSPPSLGLHQPHAPCLQAAPGNRPHQHRVGGCIERRPHVGVAGMGDPAGIVLLAGLEASRRQPEVSADSARAFEAGGIVNCRLEAQSRHVSDTWNTHEPRSDGVSGAPLFGHVDRVQERFPGASAWPATSVGAHG